MKTVINFLWFQAVWWATALLAGHGHAGWAAAPQLLFVVVELARTRARAPMLIGAIIAAGLGALVDDTLRAVGAIDFPAAVSTSGPDLGGWPSPPFMIALWAAFACTLFTSLSAVARRPLLALVVGALGGPLAYRGGAALGVLSVSDGVGGLGAVALAWGIATPLLGALTRVMTSSEMAMRRARTVPRVLLLALAAVGLAPLLWGSALLVDVVRALVQRRPFMAVRVLAFGYVYLAAQVTGIVALLLTTWSGPRLLVRTYAIQAAWAQTLMLAVQRIFALRFVVEGDTCAGPRTIALVRHASIIDTLVPSTFITRAHGVKLRFVVKKELLEDPCLDIAGNRLPNHFVSRKAEDTEQDLAAIRQLAVTLEDDEGLLVYPEGTRFTPAKRDRIVAALTDPELKARAATMRHVLPPKPAGVGALLDGAPDADAIIIAHTGLEGFATVADVFSGALVGRTVSVKMWRVPRAHIPTEKRERALWLYETWRDVDAFIDAHQAR